MAGEFLPSVKAYHHMRVYYFIVMQYTPSFMIVAFVRRNTFKLLDAAASEEMATEKCTVVYEEAAYANLLI